MLEGNGGRSVQTSTTNIGAYLWSAVAAERLGIIGRAELDARAARTLTTLERMERHAPSGQFYNWYDHRDGAKLTQLAADRRAAGPDPLLRRQRLAGDRPADRRADACRRSSARARALYDSMDFGFYYVPDANRILFHYSPAKGTGPCCYDTVVSESRIADYVGIAKGELPRKAYYGRWRTFPDSCHYSFQETRPSGFDRSYDGVTVYEGSYPYGSTRLTPSWGGSMFEALMPALFVPEERWGAGSWRMNHPYTVDAQIDHGLNVAQYGMWGFSPSNTPEGGYGGLRRRRGRHGPERDALQRGRHARRPRLRGLRRARPPKPDPPASAYTNGVVTPHAAFLALRYRRAGGARQPGADRADPRRLRPAGASPTRVNVGDRLPVAGPAVARPGDDHGRARQRARRRRAARRVLRRRRSRRAVRPVLGVEEFNVQPRGCTITGTAGDDRLTGTARRRRDLRPRRQGPGRWPAAATTSLFGDAGDDRLEGGAGADTAYGGDGADRLRRRGRRRRARRRPGPRPPRGRRRARTTPSRGG